MIIIMLEISETFFTTLLVHCEAVHDLAGKCIVLRLSEELIQIEQQKLGHLQSVVVAKTTLQGVAHAVIVERFADHDNEAELLAKVRDVWPSAFEVRGEERLRGIGHYMLPKFCLVSSHLHVPGCNRAFECGFASRSSILSSFRVS